MERRKIKRRHKHESTPSPAMSAVGAPASRASVVLQRLENAALIENDKNNVRDYVTRELFEKVIFIWDQKSLDVDGVLHKDYLAKCKALIADGELESLSDEESATYMNLLWNMMRKDHCYEKWMQSKRSNTYQAMQYKFKRKSRSLASRNQSLHLPSNLGCTMAATLTVLASS